MQDLLVCPLCFGEFKLKGSDLVCIDCGHKQEPEEKRKNDDKPKREEVPGSTTVTDSFHARNLRVENLIDADIDIQVHDLPEVDISITGPEALVKKFTMGQESVNWVYITGQAGGNTGAMIFNNGVMTIRGVQVTVNSIGGNSIVVVGNGENEVKITVKVPLGAELKITDTVGKTTIGDTDGILTIYNSLSGHMDIGKVKSTNISIPGSSHIRIDEVNGDLTVKISGSGNVRVERGNVKSLIARIPGSGKINFQGNAQSANLSISGSGKIYLDHVEQPPSRSVTGSGKIEIGNYW